MDNDRDVLEGFGFCFAWLDDDAAQPHVTRGAARSTALWEPDSRITLSFMDGSPALHERIYAVATQWLHRSEASLDFDVLKDIAAADIRISFCHPGSWSMIGTECRKVKDLERPTMNFGALTEDSEEQVLRKVVLHEFGHALGLLHEHQHPEHPFEWDRDGVYEDLQGPPNNWSREKVERNLFLPFSEDETVLHGFDADSIMLYPIPAQWTVDGRSFSGNDDLSSGDIELISVLYCG